MTQVQRVFMACFILSFAFAWSMLTLTHPAYAQTVVDMRPAASSMLEFVAATLGTVLTVVGGFAIRFMSAKIGLANSQLEQSMNDRLNEIIHRGIDYAYVTALNEVNKPGSGLSTVKFDNYFMALAASYVNTSAPGIIKGFSITQDRIEDMIRARFPAYFANIPVAGGLALPASAAPLA